MEGKPISKEEARAMANRYQKANPGGTQNVYFDAACVKGLSNMDAAGLRVHMAMKEDNTVTVILDDGENLMEFGGVCPPVCPQTTAF